MKSFFREFKQFISAGNMLELSVAVILGAAVKTVIDAFVNGIMMQLIAAVVGKTDFSAVIVSVGNTPLYVGTFVTTVINLVSIGLVLFVMVKAYNRLKKVGEAQAAAEAFEEAAANPPGPTEVELLTEIRDALKARG